jgi:hypothetical protein
VDKYPRAEHKKFDNETDALVFLRVPAQASPAPPVTASIRVPVPAPIPTHAPGPAAVLAIAQTDVDSDASVSGSTLCTVVYAQGVCSEHHVQDSAHPRIAGVGVWFGDNDPRYVLADAVRCLTLERSAET